MTIRWSSPYRHSRKTANTDIPVNIIHNSRTLRSDVSAPGGALSALAVALMLRQLLRLGRAVPSRRRPRKLPLLLNQRPPDASKDICPRLVGKISRVTPHRLAFDAN